MAVPATSPDRALAQAFGFASPVDASLIAADPFLLLPSFLSTLPSPLGRLALDDGLLTVVDGAMTWVVVPMTLRQEAFDLACAGRAGHRGRQRGRPDRQVAAGRESPCASAPIFFADHGARTAIDEATIAGDHSKRSAPFVLIVGVFRRLSPLLLNLLALVVGIAVAFAGTFLRVRRNSRRRAAVRHQPDRRRAVDYGLHYCDHRVRQRRRQRDSSGWPMSCPRITLGLITTLIGYAALAIAPFPGLKQIAVFALIGLVGAFATVALWFPLLDRLTPLRHGARLLRLAALPWVFWTAERHRIGRAALVACCLATLGLGFARYHVDDDVRRLQALSPTLLREQDEIRRLVGAATESAAPAGSRGGRRDRPAARGGARSRSSTGWSPNTPSPATRCSPPSCRRSPGRAPTGRW